ncbi:MAG TPA: protoporphyrinogen oxidase [Candidatus Limnocylindrales bacterium]|nr:protoporphyrinogen oxidase [Candidatus Limnocylindrales bacterium]
MKPRIVIVGAGIAGLTAAYRADRLARERGLDVEVVLLEGSSRAGGVIESVEEEGCLLELGPDSIITEKPWARALAEEIGLKDRIIGTSNEHRQSFVALGNKLHPIPEGFYMMAPTRLSTFAASRLFSLPGKARMAMDLVLPRRTDASDESLASFVTRRLGREALDRAAQPMVGGIYTADPARLSLRATMPRFVEMERRHRSLILGLSAAMKRSAAAPGSTAGPRYSLFISFDKGLSVLPSRLCELLPQGCVRTGVMVESVERREDGRWIVHTLDTAQERIEADAVCLATPAYASARILESASPELARSLNGIEYASTAIVNLLYRRADIAHPLHGFGFVVPAVERRTLLACTFSSVKYAGRAPEGMVLIRGFVGGALFPEHFEMPDERMLAGIDRDLAELLGVRARPRHARIVRWPRSMPQYNVGHLERVARIEDEAGRLPAFALAGAALHGVGIPDCVRSGEAAAERLVLALARGR